MKKEQKDKLKAMSVKELMKKLQELDTERIRLESWMFKETGTSTLVRNYPLEKQLRPIGNIKRIKKDIARIKTWLNIKLKSPGKC